MNNFNLNIDILTPVFIIAVIFRLLASYLLLRALIYARREYAGNDGLKELKKHIVILLLLLFHVNTIGFIFFLVRPFANPWLFAFTTNALTILNSFTFFLIGLVMIAILTKRYSNKK